MVDEDCPQQLCNIDEPTENDIIFGQGGNSIHHVGSKHWRKEIRNRMTEHHSCTRTGKAELCRQIVQQVLENGGRFLQKNAEGKWDALDKKKAVKKAAQRFRDERSSSDRAKLRCRTGSASSGNPSTKYPTENFLQWQSKFDFHQAGIFTQNPHENRRNIRLLNRDIDATLNRLKIQSNREVKPKLEQIPLTTSNSPVAESQQPQQLRDIGRVNDNDVLFGRGSHCSHHKGNIQWRRLITDGMTEYCLTKRSKRKELSCSIIQQVRANSGRFLVKNKNGKWDDIGNEEAGKKTMQRFRDQHKEDAKY